MNLLLSQLQRAGVMKHAAIAFKDARMIERVRKLPDRVVMHMGEDAHPGPYWAVHADDVEALEAQGYKRVRI